MITIYGHSLAIMWSYSHMQSIEIFHARLFSLMKRMLNEFQSLKRHIPNFRYVTHTHTPTRCEVKKRDKLYDNNIWS